MHPASSGLQGIEMGSSQPIKQVSFGPEHECAWILMKTAIWSASPRRSTTCPRANS